MFIEPAAPHDNYLLTYNCLACPDNAKTFNDGTCDTRCVSCCLLAPEHKVRMPVCECVCMSVRARVF